ncbi:MAG: iron transporter [Candidatus Promineifilaceae bacterium]|nr:iron transporter [Candidatus Promineifilaceae bacterium]
MTQHEAPPMKVSEEAKEKHLELARKQGEAYVEALRTMVNEEADDGGEQRAGDYIVAYAVEKAEGMYHLRDGDLVWVKPDDENCHIEISVRDAADNRFIPGLDVHVRLIASNGDDVGKHKQPLLWHPWLYHYGRNWRVPGDGDYRMQVTIDAPQLPRHDPKNGKRYPDSVDVTFDNVKIKTGQK